MAGLGLGLGWAWKQTTGGPLVFCATRAPILEGPPRLSTTENSPRKLAAAGRAQGSGGAELLEKVFLRKRRGACGARIRLELCKTGKQRGKKSLRNFGLVDDSPKKLRWPLSFWRVRSFTPDNTARPVSPVKLESSLILRSQRSLPSLIVHVRGLPF